MGGRLKFLANNGKLVGHMLSQYALEKPGNAEKILLMMDRLLSIYGRHLNSIDTTERPYVVIFYGSLMAEDFVTKGNLDLGKGPMEMEEALDYTIKKYETAVSYVSRYFKDAIQYAKSYMIAHMLRVPKVLSVPLGPRVDWLPNPPLNVFGPDRARRFL